MKYDQELTEKVKESIQLLKGNPHAEVFFNNLVHLREDSVKNAYSPESVKDPAIMAYYVSHIDLLDEILSPVREVYEENFT